MSRTKDPKAKEPSAVAGLKLPLLLRTLLGPAWQRRGLLLVPTALRSCQAALSHSPSIVDFRPILLGVDCLTY
jgi:hypothetical protein